MHVDLYTSSSYIHLHRGGEGEEEGGSSQQRLGEARVQGDWRHKHLASPFCDILQVYLFRFASLPRVIAVLCSVYAIVTACHFKADIRKISAAIRRASCSTHHDGAARDGNRKGSKAGVAIVAPRWAGRNDD